MRSPRGRGQSIHAKLYRTSFLRHVHLLLQLGYQRLLASRSTVVKEEEITGELVRCIEEVLDGPPPSISSWSSQFSIQEEPRFNAPGRYGKRRLRADIRIVSSEVLPRARFPFEAKRLGKRHSAQAYLGPEGLGAFVSGEYAPEQADVGMLGYVQSGTPQDWADKIAAEMAGDPQQYCVRRRGEWRQHSLLGEDIEFAYESCHDRPTIGREVTVSHTLLVFC